MEIVTTYRIINIIVLFSVVIGYPLLAILALISLRKRKLSNIATSIWALIILAIPFLGALAIWIVNPQKEEKNEKITNNE